MTTRRTKSSSETAAARPSTSSMSAETIAAGTTAGALMLGVVQAHAARKDAALETAPPAVDTDDPLSALLAAGDLTVDAAHDRQTVDVMVPGGSPGAAMHSDDGSISSPSAEAGGADATAPALPAFADNAAVFEAGAADMAPVADIEVIAARISDQVVAAIGQIAEGLQADRITAELGKSIAAEIADTAVSIARGIDVAATVDAGLDRIAGALPTVETIADQLAALPADLLGAETANDLGGGVLSDLFYSDGAAAEDLLTLAPVPSAALDAVSDLSDAASSFVEGAAAPVTDLIGLSYVDAPDLPYSGMQSSIGALHVI